jgi:predicted  nucleic acid-binding Zn-ribbon protein
MAVDYLKDYLGIDPTDYSAMEQGIAGISPLALGQSILPQAPVMPRASIMDEDDFAAATAPLMDRVYARESQAREKAENLGNQLQALQEEMANTSEFEVQKRAELERQIENIMAERDKSNLSAEDLATQLQGVQADLLEITSLRDAAVQDFQQAVEQQDVIRQQASENTAMQLEEQRNSLLSERENIVTTLEQDFGVERSELESVIGGLEGQVGDLQGQVSDLESVRTGLEGQISDLSSQMQNLEVEKQDAIAQQDVIRAELAQAQQDALAEQAEEFGGERTSLEQQIADLQSQLDNMASTPGTATGGGEAPPMTPPSGGPLAGKGGNVFDITDGELPGGFSYTPPKGMMYTTVMPSPGFRYAYGPDGQRIEVKDGRTTPTIDKTPISLPPAPPQKPPRDEMIFVPPKNIVDINLPKDLPPKRDDFMSIDRIPTDPRTPIASPTQKGVILGPNLEIGPSSGGIGARPDLPKLPRSSLFGGKGVANDFMSIDRIPTDPRLPIEPPRIPKEPITPIKPRPMPVKKPVNSIFAPISQPKQDLFMPRQRNLPSFGSVRPRNFGLPVMFRADGGSISQAIADLQNKMQ